jgi:serine/threonine protein kinase
MAFGPFADDTGASAGIKLGARKRSRLERGTCVARYVILDALGEGGTGEVYKAYDPQLQRTVVLELLAGQEQRSRRDRILREAQALARLSHPNVVAVHDVGVHRTSVFIAMELVEGQSARRWLEAGPRGPGDILDLYLAAGEGLVAAHRAGLVHRDFNADSIMVGDNGRVRVLDFGLARSIAATAGASPRRAHGEDGEDGEDDEDGDHGGDEAPEPSSRPPAI